MNGSSNSRQRNLIRVLLLGAIIVIACLAVCVFLVRDLQSVYRKEIMQSYHEHNTSSAEVISAYIRMVEKYARDGVGTFNEENAADNYEMLLSILNYYSEVESVTYSMYVDQQGNIYTKDGKAESDQWNDEYDTINKLAGNATKEVIRVISIESDDGKDLGSGKLLVMEPINAEKPEEGFFILVADLSEFLYASALDFQNKMGECYIINKNLDVLGKTVSDSMTDKNSNFMLGVLAYSGGLERSKRSLKGLKIDVEEGKDGYITVDVKEHSLLQISYSSISEIPDYYFVTCYDVNLTENKTQPFLFRCVLACLGIMFLMLLIVVYVWATSKRANLTIEKLAYEDPVTKGKNINYFKDFATKVMDVFKETPFVIYRFDIANFRYVNEAYGHTRADIVLMSCVKRFEEVFSEKELCVRMNADQFLAILVNDHQAEGKLEKFREMVNADARGRGIKYPIKFKCGVYQVKKHDRDIDVMIDHANVARKTLSGTEKEMKAVYTDNIITDMRKTDKIESEMQHALANGEFHVYYQPKWDIISDHVAGAEALIRWIKPDGSMVYPNVFIPIFEKNGFVELLDFYTLEEVCRQMRQLLDEGRTIYPISVNQSRLLLHSPDYIQNVEKIVKKYNIPENAIELEITETVFQDDQEKMYETMEQLKKCGVRLSMDDFGSGYSSLNMLKTAPFDIIKIDREFFSESVTSHESMWILQKIIEMVNGLGMEIICEGVENAEQVELLRELGCRLVQGFFYSRPIPSKDFVDGYCEKGAV